MADPAHIFIRALLRKLPPEDVRDALHVALDELVDECTERQRRAPTRVRRGSDAAPGPDPANDLASPPDELAQHRAAVALKRRGLVP